MKQHSADGCAAPGRGASDTTWPTLQRRTRFGDDQNTVVATQRRARRGYDGRATVVRATRCGRRLSGQCGSVTTVVATQRRVTRCGRRFPGGTRFGNDQNTVLSDTAGSATGGRPECSSEPRLTAAMSSRGRRARYLTPLTLSHSALWASALLKSAQRRRHLRHHVTASQHLGSISPLRLFPDPLNTSLSSELLTSPGPRFLVHSPRRHDLDLHPHRPHSHPPSPFPCSSNLCGGTISRSPHRASSPFPSAAPIIILVRRPPSCPPFPYSFAVPVLVRRPPSPYSSAVPAPIPRSQARARSPLRSGKFNLRCHPRHLRNALWLCGMVYTYVVRKFESSLFPRTANVQTVKQPRVYITRPKHVVHDALVNATRTPFAVRASAARLRLSVVEGATGATMRASRPSVEWFFKM